MSAEVCDGLFTNIVEALFELRLAGAASTGKAVAAPDPVAAVGAAAGNVEPLAPVALLRLGAVDIG